MIRSLFRVARTISSVQQYRATMLVSAKEEKAWPLSDLVSGISVIGKLVREQTLDVRIGEHSPLIGLAHQCPSWEFFYDGKYR